VKVTLDENKTSATRNATITIAYTGGSQTIAVSQLSDEIIVPNGYTLVWNDEFNNPALTMPDETNWWYETGNGGWGNNEIQNYVAGKKGSNVVAEVSNGTLKIKCMKVGSEIISARMNTNESWTYGYMEARLKLPKGKGTWPAFWMMPKNYVSWPGSGEIDIMEEVGYNPNYTSSSIHCDAYNHTLGTQKTAEVLTAGAQDEFHVYALEWTADYIKTYVDGKQLLYFANDKQGKNATWPFSNPFYIKLNLAWGGDWGGAQGVDESCLPATYEIDYVRVFQKK
jgi:beta-glucanase (GH16 family)